MSGDPYVGLEPGVALRFETLEEFAGRAEESAEPLLGNAADMALPAGGTLLLYGDGGTSKTALTIDAVFHFAAGVSWLGLDVSRPLTVLVIENEGPRGPYRAKLERKKASWAGQSVAERVHVLEDPWGAFTFADETHRAELAGFVLEADVELVVCGPLAALGAEGGGTPDEVNAFERLLVDLRERCSRPLAFWIVHHENKAGDVSGAWARMPDTLVHARLEGRERTLLHWRKARWSSALHGERWTLAWAEHEGFALVDEAESEAAKAAERADALAWILDYVSTNPGASKSVVAEAFGKAHGRGGRALARRAIDEDLEGEHSQLAKGKGRAPNGVYLYPASDLSSPLADSLFGERGEQNPDLRSEECSPARRDPVGGAAASGEQADGDVEELAWR